MFILGVVFLEIANDLKQRIKRFENYLFYTDVLRKLIPHENMDFRRTLFYFLKNTSLLYL